MEKPCLNDEYRRLKTEGRRQYNKVKNKKSTDLASTKKLIEIKEQLK